MIQHLPILTQTLLNMISNICVSKSQRPSSDSGQQFFNVFITNKTQIDI